MSNDTEARVKAYNEIKSALNMDAEGATPDEVVKQVKKLFDDAMKYRRLMCKPNPTF